jgi:amino acid adenylation domain-containing protein
MLSQAQREAVAERLRSGRPRDAAWRIPRRDDGGQDPPASFGQEQLWFLDQFAPGQAVYNVPVVIRISGHLDAGALSRALDHLVERHETLRTRLVPDAGSRPVQVIDPSRPLRLDIAALTGFEPGKRLARLRELVNAEAMRPFDLAAGPLLRTWLARLDEAEHALVVIVHHAVFDGWSAKVLLHDLSALYRSEVTGEPPGLAELPVQFADYAVWERQRLRGNALAGLERYWRDTLAGAETVEFPADRPRPAVDSPEGALAERMADAGLLAGLRELTSRQGVTMFVTVLASLLTLLHRYTGQDDLVVGTASANRGHAALQPLIGFLVNTLPIRCDLSGDPPFTSLLARTKDAVLGAFAHQELPFGKVVDALGVPRDASRNPVLQINMTYAERDDTPVPAAGARFAASDLVVGIAAAKFDLNFAVETRRGGLWTECCYKTALFDAGTIERLLAHWEVLLRGVAADPSARLSQLPLLTPAELRAELTERNDTDAPVPQACAHELFQIQVTRTPDAVAAQWGAARHDGDRVSYAVLNRQANQIARRLRDLGAGPEHLVGVCMHTGLRRLAALLGVWKAGGGYVPLDPALPAERLSFMIADADMTVILTDRASAQAVAGVGVTLLSVDDEWEQIAELDGSDLAGTGVTPASVAYVIYTSGSTGRPKGVLIEHGNLVNLLHGMAAQWTQWTTGPGPVMLGYHSCAFDMSVLDMYLPLVTGGTLVIVPPQTASSPRRLAELIRQARVTFAFLTPPVLDLLPAGEYPDLRVLMTGGDEHPAKLARRWVHPGLRLANGYGPTETTVLCSYADVGDATQSPLPFAPPVLPNYQMYVLDRQLNPVPAGVIGELHIGGMSVARGYLNRPGLTAERFIPDPFRPAPAGRLYKSGDLARRRPDGSIVFCGRIDNQVKIRGVRIELGEVESALTAHPAVAQAVVTVTAGPAGDKELTAYLRLRPAAGAVSDEDLHAHLARTLPSAMIPAHLITVGQFPLNNNGKVDKKALPAPAGRHDTGQQATATPTEATLARIYATLLGTTPGATDSFFGLGGNSLTAMRLVDMIGNETGVDISVAEVFLRPSPRELAARIDSARSATDGSGTEGTGTSTELTGPPVIQLTSGAAGPAMFLIHAVGGTVSGYAELGQHLRGAFQVYGLEAPGLSDPAALATSLAGLADDYTRRIRAAQPAGPYRLGGWSMGGVVAFEVAQRLEAAGLQVGLLVLLDAPFAVPADYVPGESELAARFAADVGNSLGLDMSAAPDPAVTAGAGQLAWLAQLVSAGNGGAGNSGAGDRGAGDRGAGGRDAMAARLAQRFGLFAAHTQMIAGYQPAAPRVCAPTLIVSAAASLNAPARLAWPRMLTGPVSVLSVDSDHYAFLRPPLVADVGAAVREWYAKHGGTDGS